MEDKFQRNPALIKNLALKKKCSLVVWWPWYIKKCGGTLGWSTLWLWIDLDVHVVSHSVCISLRCHVEHTGIDTRDSQEKNYEIGLTLPIKK